MKSRKNRSGCSKSGLFVLVAVVVLCCAAGGYVLHQRAAPNPSSVNILYDPNLEWVVEPLRRLIEPVLSPAKAELSFTPMDSSHAVRYLSSSSSGSHIGIYLKDQVNQGDPKPDGFEISPPLCYRPVVLACHYMSSMESLPLDDARRLLQGSEPGTMTKASVDPAAASGLDQPAVSRFAGLGIDDVVVAEMDDLSLGVRPIPIDQVVPDASMLVNGNYPLAQPIVAVRKSQGVAGFERILSHALGYVQSLLNSPNPAQLVWARLNEPAVISQSFSQASKSTTLVAIGDVMLDRGVRTAMSKNGITYPFEQVRDVLSRADVVLANLESPLGTKGRPIPGKLIWFRAAPESIQSLTYASIDVVTLANNHILDYDTDSLMETINLLDEHGISHTGAGADIKEARKPAIVESNGIRVAFLGYSEFANPNLYWSKSYPRTFLATPTQAGTAPIDIAMIGEDISRARAEADIVVVAFHWGQEYVNEPKPYFLKDLKKVARDTIDAGADIVLGFHPHAIQGLEVYKRGLIAYSLGNFVMDQKSEITRESMILKFLLTKSGVKYCEILPVMINDCQPRILHGEERARLMKKIFSISRLLEKP